MTTATAIGLVVGLVVFLLALYVILGLIVT